MNGPAWRCSSRLAMAALAALGGCGRAPDPAGQASTAEAVELAQTWLTERDQAAAQAQLADGAAALTPADQAKLENLKSRLERARRELAELAAAEDKEFAAVRQQAADGPADAAVVSAVRFVRNYPASERLGEAIALIEGLQADAAAAAAAKEKAQAEQEARNQAELAAQAKRCLAGDMTAPEMKQFLQGKSQAEILKLWGPPHSRTLDVWSYDGPRVRDHSGAQRGMNIFFNGGRVASIGLRQP